MSVMRQRKQTEQKSAQQRSSQGPAAAQATIEAAFRRHTSGNRWYLPAIVAIWLLAAAYYLFLPPSYHSKWSLILPTANSGSTVSLESIGQTSSTPSQPFGNVTLSPKVIYKEIARSDEVRKAAAKSLGLKPRAIGKPRVKLIDETSLMMFRMSGKTPEQAQARANALMTAFNSQLSTLRKDEQERRAELVRNNLKVYRATLDGTRAKMLAFQRKSGLHSIDQFKEASISAELLRRKLSEIRSDRQRLIFEQDRLASQLGLSTAMAVAGVRLASDPTFEKLAATYATESAKVHRAKLRLGHNHPRLGTLRLRAQGVLGEIEQVAANFGIAAVAGLPELMLVINSSGQSELLKSMIANESALAGRTRQIKSVESELKRVEGLVTKMGKAAGQLEALKKEHLVAEAVYTSAAARLDIGRTDVFDSYPMVQVLSQPTRPENRSQPRLLYAFAAGFLGSFLILMAWGAVWVHKRFGLRR